ncbi:MAG: aaeA [Burkholderiaceae bacterium]|nr:aaeA [Burkholderiaceae bacterium]
MFSNFSLRELRRYAITGATVAIAVVIGWLLWHHYENDPWTRDGRIKANVVQIAPDVTGQVTQINVHDNQHVKAGQIMFEIDRARFELALRQAEAAELAAKASLTQAVREAKRNNELKELVSAEIREQGDSKVEQLRAALAQAIVNRDKAKLDLQRTRVIAGVNGTVTNLDLQAGSYVTSGKPVMALVDSDSYFIEGYFEETKLSGIHDGAPVSIRLMSDDAVLEGHVESVSRGIADRERTTSSNLLQNINPAFNWVRLVQRIPVRIKLDHVPDDVRLIAGQTVTVVVKSAKKERTAQSHNGKQPG